MSSYNSPSVKLDLLPWLWLSAKWLKDKVCWLVIGIRIIGCHRFQEKQVWLGVNAAYFTAAGDCWLFWGRAWTWSRHWRWDPEQRAFSWRLWLSVEEVSVLTFPISPIADNVNLSDKREEETIVVMVVVWLSWLRSCSRFEGRRKKYWKLGNKAFYENDVILKRESAFFSSHTYYAHIITNWAGHWPLEKNT